jgi:hypothetical protein
MPWSATTGSCRLKSHGKRAPLAESPRSFEGISSSSETQQEPHSNRPAPHLPQRSTASGLGSASASRQSSSAAGRSCSWASFSDRRAISTSWPEVSATNGIGQRSCEAFPSLTPRLQLRRDLHNHIPALRLRGQNQRSEPRSPGDESGAQLCKPTVAARPSNRS